MKMFVAAAGMSVPIKQATNFLVNFISVEVKQKEDLWKGLKYMLKKEGER